MCVLNAMQSVAIERAALKRTSVVYEYTKLLAEQPGKQRRIGNAKLRWSPSLWGAVEPAEALKDT